MTTQPATLKIRPGRKWIAADYELSAAGAGNPASADSDADVRIPLTGWLHTETAFDNTFRTEEFFPEGFPVYSDQDPRNQHRAIDPLAKYRGDRADTIGRTFWITPEQAEEHIDRSTDSDPTSLMLDAGHRGMFNDDIWNYEEDGNGFLAWVQFTGGIKYGSSDTAADDEDDEQEVRLEYRVIAAHLPCDIYGPKGTPMRDLYDTLVNSPRLSCLHEAMNENWSEELVQQLNDDTAAAIEALKASGHPFWAQHEVTWWGQPFPPGGVDNTLGTEYIALHARHLIGTTPSWTPDAYNRCSAAYLAATGRPLHPDDDAQSR